jgi:hypothetical protein
MKKKFVKNFGAEKISPEKKTYPKPWQTHRPEGGDAPGETGFRRDYVLIG